MDPMDLARAVLDGVRENRPYIIGHPEFVEEMEELHRELMACIRHDLPVHPGRLEMEAGRRNTVRRLKSQMGSW